MTDVDRRRLRQVRTVPPPLEGISRVSTVKILGVLVSDTLAFTEHVDAIISSGAQTLHALRVLRGHGMGDDALQRVFQSVIVAKLQYASSAWWGFSNAKERKRIEAFIQRSRRSRFVPEDLPEFEDICRASDDSLFRRTLIMFYTIFFQHNLLLHRTIISVAEYINCKFRPELTV